MSPRNLISYSLIRRITVRKTLTLSLRYLLLTWKISRERTHRYKLLRPRRKHAYLLTLRVVTLTRVHWTPVTKRDRKRIRRICLLKALETSTRHTLITRPLTTLARKEYTTHTSILTWTLVTWHLLLILSYVSYSKLQVTHTMNVRAYSCVRQMRFTRINLPLLENNG